MSQFGMNLVKNLGLVEVRVRTCSEELGHEHLVLSLLCKPLEHVMNL